MARTPFSRLRASPLLARLRNALPPKPARAPAYGELAQQPDDTLVGPWPAALQQGINLVGYASGGLGLGENLRRFAEALDAARLPFSLIDFRVNLDGRGVDDRLARHIGTENPYPVNLFFVNADQMPFVHRHFGPEFFAGRRNIGFWFWELEGFPNAWSEAFDLVDEVWVATDFIRNAIAACTRKPVHRLILPISLTPPAHTPSRAALGLPDRGFLFHFHFDFRSFVQRKNPQAVIAAFQQAFPAGDRRAVLLVKTINGTQVPEALAALREAVAPDPRIVVMDGFLSHEDNMGLMMLCDAFVSLHRSEGFGMGLAEAMYLGKPVIATGYSGNLEFMTPDNSALVRHRMIPVGPDDYLHGEGQQWADPEVGHAAGLMRRLVDSPAYARALGQAGAESIRRTHSRRACLDSMARALAGACAIDQDR